MMITLDDYWMGRDIAHAADLTPEIRENAIELLGRVNLLQHWAAADGIYPGTDAVTGTPVASGWRPPVINASVGGGPLHPKAEAIDLRDTPERAFARWCLSNIAALDELGLWMEDPQWTPTWVHLQKRPPRSGRRVFVPKATPPLVAKLPEQIERGVA